MIKIKLSAKSDCYIWLMKILIYFIIHLLLVWAYGVISYHIGGHPIAIGLRFWLYVFLHFIVLVGILLLVDMDKRVSFFLWNLTMLLIAVVINISFELELQQIDF